MTEHQDLIESIQNSGYKACIALAGGGSGAVHALLKHPGASRFVLDAQIPYSREAMAEYLGEIPASFCSEDTARKLADVALSRATRFGGALSKSVGISCTAALRTTQKRTDSDRAFICINSPGKVMLHKVEFSLEERLDQERELSSILLHRLYEFVRS